MENEMCVMCEWVQEKL